MTKNLFAAACLLVAAFSSTASASELWHITFESNWLGPMEAHVEIRRDTDQIRGVSQSGAVSVIRELPGDHSVEDGLMVFEATANPDGSFSGSFLAPWREGALQLTIDGDTLSGSVEGGAFAGSLTGKRVQDGRFCSRLRGYPENLRRSRGCKDFRAW